MRTTAKPAFKATRARKPTFSFDRNVEKLLEMRKNMGCPARQLRAFDNLSRSCGNRPSASQSRSSSSGCAKHRYKSRCHRGHPQRNSRGSPGYFNWDRQPEGFLDVIDNQTDAIEGTVIEVDDHVIRIKDDLQDVSGTVDDFATLSMKHKILLPCSKTHSIPLRLTSMIYKTVWRVVRRLTGYTYFQGLGDHMDLFDDKLDILIQMVRNANAH